MCRPVSFEQKKDALMASMYSVKKNKLFGAEVNKYLVQDGRLYYLSHKNEEVRQQPARKGIKTVLYICTIFVEKIRLMTLLEEVIFGQTYKEIRFITCQSRVHR